MRRVLFEVGLKTGVESARARASIAGDGRAARAVRGPERGRALRRV